MIGIYCTTESHSRLSLCERTIFRGAKGNYACMSEFSVAKRHDLPVRTALDCGLRFGLGLLALLISTGQLFFHASTWANPQELVSSAAQDHSQPEANAWLSRAVEIAQRRMVKVYGAGAGRVNSYATGMIVSPEGHIVTMQGVFLDGDQVRVALPDGQLVTAGVVRRDRQFQLALLQTSVATPDFFELSDELVGNKGDWVVALSNAFMVAEREEPMSATLGIISLVTSIEARLNQDNVAYSGELVLIDAITSNPGAGGGAVVLPDGTLVGMIGKVINSSDTNTRLNYAVPSRILKRFVAGEPLSETTPSVVASDQRPTLGFELFKHGGKGGPAYVDRVLPGGPAAAAGLKPDDLIVSMGGEKIGSIRDYDRVLPTLTVGSESILVVKRGQELLRLPITPVAQK